MNILDFAPAIKKLCVWPFMHPPKNWQHGTLGTVILIPGFLSTWNFLLPLGNYLNSLGYKILIVKEIDFNIYSLDYCLTKVRRTIFDNDLKSVILVGHSKGGLIARLTLKDSLVNKRVAKVITLATPYGGNPHVAKYAWLFKLRELLPESPFINKAQSVSRSDSKKIVNLYSKFDNVIRPKSCLILKGVTNIEINISGHNRILSAPETLTLLAKYL